MKTILVQAILDHLGYDTGGVDGIPGKKTQQAIRNFQSDFGLTADGIAGADTCKALGHSLCYGMDSQPSLKKPLAEVQTGTEWDGIKYFAREEFRCKCGGQYCDGFPAEPHLQTVRWADAIRERRGPLGVSSGLRCARWNAIQGGVSDSQHLYGAACDLYALTPGVTPEQMAKDAEDIMGDTGGIGIYSWGIHIDDRAVKSRWRG